MNTCDVDEILNYLSNKFNKIFCEREFVYNLIQDFQIIQINCETKCCVVVFPALGPIYLKALKYQAKINDFTVFSIGTNHKFKLYAVCHKNYLISNSKNFCEVAKDEEIMANTTTSATTTTTTTTPVNSRNKRPERKLYIPPAQRRSLIKDNSKCNSKLKDKMNKRQNNNNNNHKSDNKNKLMNLNDINDISLNLILFNNSSSIFYNNINKSNYFQHWNCEFETYLNYKKFITINKHIIPIYNLNKTNTNYYQSLINYTFNNLNIKSNQKFRKDEQDEIIIKLQQNSVFLETNLNYTKILNEFNEQNYEMYKIICDSKCDDFNNNFQVIDLSLVNLGHYCYISLNNQDYIYQCQEQHDPGECYLNKLNELIVEKNEMFNSNNNNNNKVGKSLENKLLNECINNNNNNKEIINNTKNDKKSSMKKNEHEQEKEIMRRAKENMNRKIRPIMKYVDEESNNTLKIDKNDGINDWEDLFDDDGKIQEELLTEIVQKVGNDVTVVKANEDYSAYTNKPIEELEHVVELYNFPSTLATHDLVQAFSDINSDAMYVKWVDDTHALLVLGSLTQAQKAVDMGNSLIKVRPMTAASSISKDVANKSNLRPAMKRPPTNLQTARRLITTHLGTKSKLSKEQMAKEKQDLKNARELKKLTKQNERDAWEGNLKSSVNN